MYVGRRAPVLWLAISKTKDVVCRVHPLETARCSNHEQGEIDRQERLYNNNIDMFFRMYEIMNCLFRLSSCNRYGCNLHGTKNGHDRVTGITCDEGDVGEQEAVVECAVCIRVRLQMARCTLRESHMQLS